MRPLVALAAASVVAAGVWGLTGPRIDDHHAGLRVPGGAIEVRGVLARDVDHDAMGMGVAGGLPAPTMPDPVPDGWRSIGVEVALVADEGGRGLTWSAAGLRLDVGRELVEPSGSTLEGGTVPPGMTATIHLEYRFAADLEPAGMHVAGVRGLLPLEVGPPEPHVHADS